MFIPPHSRSLNLSIPPSQFFRHPLHTLLGPRRISRVPPPPPIPRALSCSLLLSTLSIASHSLSQCAHSSLRSQAPLPRTCAYKRFSSLHPPYAIFVFPVPPSLPTPNQGTNDSNGSSFTFHWKVSRADLEATVKAWMVIWSYHNRKSVLQSLQGY